MPRTGRVDIATGLVARLFRRTVGANRCRVRSCRQHLFRRSGPAMPAPGYLRFAFADPANARFLAFGFAMTFASSVGQTYFIGAFGPALRGEFGLSHTGWSAIYMAGTLVSALVLPWTGKLIDSMSLRTYTAIVSAALVLAAAFMAVVPTGRGWHAISAPPPRRATMWPIAARRSPWFRWVTRSGRPCCPSSPSCRSPPSGGGRPMAPWL